jgi:phage terminase small subunit
MNRKKWAELITANCKSIGTYKVEFDPVIDTLAGVLEKRDKVEQEFQEAGAEAVIIHTNQGGNANMTKNPMLVAIGELNTQALAYWRDLGLTPAGLRKLNEQAFQKKKTSALAEVLKELG